MIDLTAIFRPSAATASAPWVGARFFPVGGFPRSTSSGETVSPESSLTLSAYFACLRVLSEDVGKLPLDVYKRLSGPRRGKEYLPDDPLAALLESPNREMTGQYFRELLTHWAAGWGHGYAEIVRLAGRPVQMWPIHPSRVERIRNARRELIYRVRGENGEQAVTVDFPQEDIFEIANFGGYSVAALAAESIGVGLAAERFGAAFFGQGTTLSGILTHPGKLDEPAKKNLRESWQSTYGGTRNTKKVAVLEEGLTWQQISVPPEEAQFLETRQFQVEEICRWFRIAPHKIQHLLHATFSNIEHQGREHVTDALLPWLTRWTSEVKHRLITDPLMLVAFDVHELTRGDMNARANYNRTMFNIGALSPNDIRELEDENPIADPAADLYYVQMNMAPIATIANPPAAPAPAAPFPNNDDEDADAAARRLQFNAQREALRGAFLAEADRVLTKEAKAVPRAAEKPGFEAWAQTFYASQVDYLIAAMSPLCSALEQIAANVLGVPVVGVDLSAFARDYCAQSLAYATSTKSIPADHTPAALSDAVVSLVSEAYHA